MLRDLTERLRQEDICEYCMVSMEPSPDSMDAASLLDAVDELHQPIGDDEYGGSVCRACSTTWPCRTHRLLHQPVGG